MLQVSFGDRLTGTWLYNHRYCILTPTDVNGTGSALAADLGVLEEELPMELSLYVNGPPHGFDDDQMLCRSSSTIYWAAFYWAVMTITSVGYGNLTLP